MVLNHITAGFRTGSELWSYLEETHMPNNVSHQTSLFSKSLAIKYSTLVQFVKDIRASTTELKIVGLHMINSPMVIMTLSELPKDLESFVRVLSHNMMDETTPAFVLLPLQGDAHQQATIVGNNLPASYLSW